MDNVDEIIIINMAKDRARLKNIRHEIDKLNHPIKVTVIKGINGNEAFSNIQHLDPSHMGCTASHIKAWEYVVKNKLKNFMIVEDDCFFCENFMDKMKEYQQNLPANWDFIYWGYMGLANKNKTYRFIDNVLFKLPYIGKSMPKNNFKKYNSYFFTPEIPIGLHCYSAKYEFLEKMIKEIQPINNLPDVELAIWFGNNKYENVYCSSECIANQDFENYGSNNFVLYGGSYTGFRLSNFRHRLLGIPINGYFYVYSSILFFVLLYLVYRIFV